ncbi:siderophore biosynthesis [Fusarium sporotrichioides]|uniref:Siderophore biosynthesis n=1 Tax=Fusarium sporotrichioides TaxID=5514 RepID=A0A395S148_FUSSP|nr:siderophore biosynthesis [Fusarium sporotrichioides]
MARSIALAALLYALPIAAKTDIEGCTSFTSTVTVRPEPGYGNTYQKVIWYVSDTLEICEGVDCGGGRAPPKSVPGCPLYKGTETVTPRFLETDPVPATPAPIISSSGSVLLSGVWYSDSGETITDDTPYTGTALEPEETRTENWSLSFDGESGETITDETPYTGIGLPEETDVKATASAKLTTITSAPAVSTHKSNGTATTAAGTDSEGAAKPTAVDVDNAGAGVMVKAAGVLAAVAGAVVLAL